jgi:hypothetical protein
MEAMMASNSKARAAKRAAGVKVPKGYRRAAGGIVRLSRNPLVREMAIAGVVAAASVLVRNKTVRTGAGKVGAGAREAANETVDVASKLGHAVAGMVAGAVERLWTRREVEVPEAPERVTPIRARGAMPHVS